MIDADDDRIEVHSCALPADGRPLVKDA